MTPTVATALRLGWAVAEVRGRNWPHGPRPISSPVPPVPGGVLPLRSQRSGLASRRESMMGLISSARQMEFTGFEDFHTELAEVLPHYDAAGDASLVDDGGTDAGSDWRRTATFFLNWDGRFQDELTERGEPLANAYLLGRGMAECYWGLGPKRAWTADGESTAVSLAFLFGEDRCRELTRMLGRLGTDEIHPQSAAAISGSLEAWGTVAADEQWSRDPQLPILLYEQVRRWFQLLMLGQDPTTLIRPGAKLTSLRNLTRNVRVFWPQAVLAVVALGLATGFFSVDHDSTPWISSLLATGGLGAFVFAGLLARGQSAAQRLVTRIRQDAYTDLVAVAVTIVPAYPSGSGRTAWRRARTAVESAVRRRRLTPPTPAPETSG